MRTMIAAIFAIAFAGVSTAQAEPPQQGSRGAIPTPVVVCDTQDQLASIIKAGTLKNEGAKDQFMQFNGKLNANAAPSCAITTVPAVKFGKSAPLGKLLVDSAAFDAFAVEISNNYGKGWFMYLESKTALAAI